MRAWAYRIVIPGERVRGKWARYRDVPLRLRRLWRVGEARLVWAPSARGARHAAESYRI